MYNKVGSEGEYDLDKKKYKSEEMKDIGITWRNMAHNAFEGDTRKIEDDYLIRQKWVQRVDGETKVFTCNHIRS